MKAKNNSLKSKAQKRSLISIIIGVSIAIFTFICCGLLVPLGLIGAAVFLHQYRIPLIILGVAIAGVSVFFMLKGKEIICFCKALELIKRYKKLIIILMGIIISIGTVVVFGSHFFTTQTKNLNFAVTPELTTSEWKSNKVDLDLVSLVNFLKGNIGKEIELAGEKHIITGKEKVSIKITMLECCTKGEFAKMLDDISKIGKVKNSDFSKKEIIAELPADEIPKIADIWNVERVSFEPKLRETWLQLIK